jgi:xanthine dehydrogenase YagS FAD-binding subunit
MQSFEHDTAASAREALAALGDAETRLLAGGTDLLPLMKAGLATPRRLIDLKPARELRYLRFEEDGMLSLGALATLADLERSPEVRARLPILTQAVRDAATPQLRALATVGGNLLQRPRCWYFRGDYGCWLQGGSECFAREGENAYHAIFEQGPCVAVHPSDLAPALVALDAAVVLEGGVKPPVGDPAHGGLADGARTLPVADFLAPPTAERRAEHVLRPGEIITGLRVPAQPGGAGGAYLKMMERQAWAFALVSAAAVLALRDGVVERARIVLGGVANTPWRAESAEWALAGQLFTRELAVRAGEIALEGAQPLRQNGYKVQMGRALVRRALLAAAGMEESSTP